MSGPVALIWLTLSFPPILGGGPAVAPGVNATPTASPAMAADTTSPSWERPARPSQAHLPSRRVDRSIPANESETEKETDGEGPEGLSSLVDIPVDPAATNRSAAHRCTDPTGHSRLLVTRLRC